MKTVLVVDDDPSILALVHYLVERAGYEVLNATSAEEAFQRFEDSDAHVDLLIADVTLPSSSGVRVALEFWSLLPNLRTIISSGYPPSMWPEQDAAELNEIAADSVIVMQKPFVPATLLESIHRLIGWPNGMAPALKLTAAS